MKKNESGLTGLRLTNYSSFRKLDNINRNLWRSKYEKRTGKKKGRGWTFSREFNNYLKSRYNRADRLREENLSDYLKNVDRVEVYEGGVDIDISIRDTEIYNAILEIIPKIEVFEIQAIRVRKRFESYAKIGRSEIYGINRIKKHLKELADAWRREMELLGKDDSPTGMKYISGSLSAKEYSRVLFVKLDLRVLSGRPKMEDDDEYL